MGRQGGARAATRTCLLLGAWLLGGCAAPTPAAPSGPPGATQPPTHTPRSTIYGISFSADYLDLPRALAALDQAAALGVGWVRFSIAWGQVEPRPGRFDWGAPDQLVGRARADRLQVLGGLRYDTAWAEGPPAASPGAIPPSHYPPVSLPAWRTYVDQTVARYRADIHYWEVWNEPDLAHFWAGTPAEYAHLLAVTHTEIQRTDPGATVVLGGLAVADGSPGGGQFLTAILKDPAYPAAGNFDIANVHVYPPAAGAAKVRYVRQALAGAGAAARPVWITEVGYPGNPQLQPDPAYQGLAGQARWLGDTLPALRQAGAAKIFWFELFDAAAGGAGFGLLDAALQPKPAYTAYRALLAPGTPSGP